MSPVYTVKVFIRSPDGLTSWTTIYICSAQEPTLETIREHAWCGGREVIGFEITDTRR